MNEDGLTILGNVKEQRKPLGRVTSGVNWGPQSKQLNLVSSFSWFLVESRMCYKITLYQVLGKQLNSAVFTEFSSYLAVILERGDKTYQTQNME
jgi:hypothetical protein